MLTQSRRKPLWRIVKLLALSVLSVLLILAIVGTAWNYLSVYSVREQNPPPGHLYDVDGHAMHLYCTGSGSPTVVLESGHGEAFTVWGKVQPGLSKVTRTCSYDRAGFGWSADQPGERDATHIVDQLHGLLESAGITDPVVLAGHSAGGLYATVYAATFPEEVAAVVLVDATSPSPSPFAIKTGSKRGWFTIQFGRRCSAHHAAKAHSSMTGASGSAESIAWSMHCLERAFRFCIQRASQPI